MAWKDGESSEERAREKKKKCLVRLKKGERAAGKDSVKK